MKKYFLLFLFFGLVGCHNSGHNLNLAAIDQQILKLRQHVVAIADDNGIYQNENLDQQLLKEIKETTIEKGNENIDLWQQGKLEQDDFQQTLEKMSSVLYFIWMEEIDSAQSANDSDRIQILQKEHDEVMNNNIWQNFWESKNKLADYARVREVIKTDLEMVNLRNEIEQNNEELNQLRQEMEQLNTENKISEYNDRVEIFNQQVEANQDLINKYNTEITRNNSELANQAFLNLIEISLLFPQQNNLQLTQ